MTLPSRQMIRYSRPGASGLARTMGNKAHGQIEVGEKLRKCNGAQ